MRSGMNSSGDITKVRGAIPPGGIEPEHHLTRLRLVSLITVVATGGGLTAEAVFSKLLGVDVPRTGGLATDGDSKK